VFETEFGLKTVSI